MRKIKLGVLGLMSLFVFPFGLDTTNQKDTSSLQNPPVIKLYTEHGEQI
jgi:hypothetical protein